MWGGGTVSNPLRLDDRFWSKVDRQVDGCWVWTAALTAGYGSFGVRHGVVRRAHRLAYEYLVGPIPEGLQLDHLCRNRACVRPDHLEPVTCRENLLRGVGPTAQRSAQTQCVNGHALTGGNVYIKPNGCRNCRACKRDANRRHEARKVNHT